MADIIGQYINHIQSRTENRPNKPTGHKLFKVLVQMDTSSTFRTFCDTLKVDSFPDVNIEEVAPELKLAGSQENINIIITVILLFKIQKLSSYTKEHFQTPNP